MCFVSLCFAYHLDLNELYLAFPTRRSSALGSSSLPVFSTTPSFWAAPFCLERAQAPSPPSSLGLTGRASARACSVSTGRLQPLHRSEEHTSELKSRMRSSYAVFCLKKKNSRTLNTKIHYVLTRAIYH